MPRARIYAKEPKFRYVGPFRAARAARQGKYDYYRNQVAGENQWCPTGIRAAWGAFKKVYPEGVPGWGDKEPTTEDFEKIIRDEAIAKRAGGSLIPDTTKPIPGSVPKNEKMGLASRRSMRQAVEWVFQVMDVDDLVPKDAPSPGAWALLRWCRESPGNRGSFYTSFVTRLLPSKVEIDREEERAEFDRAALDATRRELSRVSKELRGRHAVLSAGAEGTGSQPGVAQRPD